jgi:hypothetical protein
MFTAFVLDTALGAAAELEDGTEAALSVALPPLGW